MALMPDPGDKENGHLQPIGSRTTAKALCAKNAYATIQPSAERTWHLALVAQMPATNGEATTLALCLPTPASSHIRGD